MDGQDEWEGIADGADLSIGPSGRGRPRKRAWRDLFRPMRGWRDVVTANGVAPRGPRDACARGDATSDGGFEAAATRMVLAAVWAGLHSPAVRLQRSGPCCTPKLFGCGNGCSPLLCNDEEKKPRGHIPSGKTHMVSPATSSPPDLSRSDRKEQEVLARNLRRHGNTERLALENRDAGQFRGKPLEHEDELITLFGCMDTEEGTMLCVGGTGERTPSGGSDDNLTPMSNDNVGRSSAGRVAQRAGKEQVVDSPPPKKSKNMEYYVGRISESMLERSRNESSVIRGEQDEMKELLQLVEEDGVAQGSELYFIATDLFRSAARRAAFRCIYPAENRKSWLRWTWDHARKK
uniref:Uncharacterized protein n=1 Tax=Oryza punctata TaxID=4537 RepID=A0A0E0KQ39_ORYPU